MEVFSRSIALFLIILLSPLLIVVAIICFALQGTPIFFKQYRVGYKFKNFEIYKFRTMNENSGSLITKPQDNRITNIGTVLRKFKIDEVPQLFNILKGDMRFIGPRPEVIKYFDKNKFIFLKKIKPGISDYASIILRDESKILSKIEGNNPYEKLLPIKLELAKYYCNKKSFLLDLKLVLITIMSLIFPKFASRILGLSKLYIDIPNFKNFSDNYLR